MKGLFLVLIMVSSAFAYAPTDLCTKEAFLRNCYPYVVYEKIDFVSYAFNAVTMIFNNPIVTSNITEILLCTIFLFFIFKAILNREIVDTNRFILKGMVHFILLYLVALTFMNSNLKVSMRIADGRSLIKNTNDGANLVKIDNVPILLAFPASLMNYISYETIKLIENTITPIDGLKYSQIGLMKFFSFIDQKRAVSITDLEDKEVLNFVNIYEEYIQECILPLRSAFPKINHILDIGKGSLKTISPQLIKANYAETDHERDAIDIFFRNVTQRNINCEELYQYLLNHSEKALNTYAKYQEKFVGFENHSLVSMGLYQGFYAGSEDVIADGKSYLDPYYQYIIRGQLDILNDRAIYSKAIGVKNDTISSTSISQSINDAHLQLHNTINQSRFLFSLETLPFAITSITGIIIFAFPFVLVSAFLGGWGRTLKVMLGYFATMLFISLIPSAMAVAQSFVSTYASKDGLGHLLEFNHHVIHNYRYYQLMAERAEMSANLATYIIIGFPMLIISGVGFGLFQALNQSSANARVGGIEQAIPTLANAQDSVNRGLETTKSDTALLHAIEENNQNALNQYRSQMINDLSSGTLAQGVAQTGVTTGYGMTIQGESALKNVASGGKFMSAVQAMNNKKLGEFFDNQEIELKFNSESLLTSGYHIAKSIGSNSALQTTHTGQALIASRAFDKNTGELANTNEGAKYAMGIENVSREMLNQVIGKGIGDGTNGDVATRYSTENMSNIQANVARNTQDTLASGEMLRDKFGGMSLQGEDKTTGLSYQNIAKAQAQAGLIDTTAKATSYLQSKAFLGGEKAMQENALMGAVFDKAQQIGTNISKGDFMEENHGFSGITTMTSNLSDMQLYSSKGVAQGITHLKGIFGDADALNHIAIMQEGQTTAPMLTLDKTAQNLEKDFKEVVFNLQDAQTSTYAKQNFENVTRYQEQGSRNVYQANGSLTQTAQKELKQKGINEGAREAGEILNYTDNMENAINSALAKSDMGLSMETIKSIRNGASFEDLSKEQKKEIMDIGKNVENKNLGISPNKTIDKFITNFIADSDRQEILQKLGLETLQKQIGNTQSDFMNKSNYTKLDGMINGETINLVSGNGGVAGSLSSGISFSHNESRNYSYGINASGGSLWASIAKSHGIDMQDYATGSMVANGIASFATTFAPGGGLAKGLVNFGILSPNNPYAKGLGQSGFNAMNYMKQKLSPNPSQTPNHSQVSSLENIGNISFENTGNSNVAKNIVTNGKTNNAIHFENKNRGNVKKSGQYIHSENNTKLID